MNQPSSHFRENMHVHTLLVHGKGQEIQGQMIIDESAFQEHKCES
jgi:hypothetical protein